MLQVCLAVEIFSLNIANAFRVGTIDEYQVAWEIFVLSHFDQLADFNIAPSSLLNTFAFKGLNFATVLLVVRLMPIIIFINVLHHADKENDGESTEASWNAGRIQGLETLHDANEQEIKVRQLSELFEQVQRNKI
jgi:hypothetical protein